MQSTMPPFVPDTPQPYFYPPNIPDYQRSNPSSRRTSAATTTHTSNTNNNNTYSPSRSSRSMRDRRSSGAISTHSQQKPKKCIGDYVVGKTLGKGASGKNILNFSEAAKNL